MGIKSDCKLAKVFLSVLKLDYVKVLKIFWATTLNQEICKCRRNKVRQTLVFKL